MFESNMKSLLLTLLYGIISTYAFAQFPDSTKPIHRVSLAEFREALSDSRDIYVEITTDSLVGPVRQYRESKFYIEDETVIDCSQVKRITEHWSYAAPGTLYGFLGGLAIGGAISLSILLRVNEPQGAFGSAALMAIPLSCGSVGALIGTIIGSRFERGYDFPIEALERE